jgi:hypothetical protein
MRAFVLDALKAKVPFGYRRGDSGELVPQEAEQEALRKASLSPRPRMADASAPLS